MEERGKERMEGEEEGGTGKEKRGREEGGKAGGREKEEGAGEGRSYHTEGMDSEERKRTAQGER